MIGKISVIPRSYNGEISDTVMLMMGKISDLFISYKWENMCFTLIL